MSGKLRLIGSGGAVFVPNCDEQTIKDRLESGEWQKVDEPKTAEGPKRKTAPRSPKPPAQD